MNHFPIFLSVVYVVRNHEQHLEGILLSTTAQLSSLVSDYEIIVIDKASDDQSLVVLKKLTSQSGLPNLQVYALIKEVDNDTAAWVGLENALGDFIAIIDPLKDDISFLPEMLDKAVNGADVVFASNAKKAKQGILYELAYAAFNRFYKIFNGIHLEKEAPQYRLLSRRVVNFIHQHPQPAITYRHLPATGGFTRANMEYSSEPHTPQVKRVGESINRGIRLLVSTTRAPMRLVTFLSLFGAIANLIYSIYVVAIGIFKTNVAPGWVSLSLQQSGMFFLISLVLLVLGEYILHMASLSNEGPLYHVGQEFTSAHMTRREKLNIEEAASPQAPSPRTTEKQLVR
ncbi:MULTISPECIES: glycosyltransferase [unclassified Acidovorax]|uniref:glycosyltransferase n=1 Tax=unclassified Acidovorax TaxID=2684926 RepID=UPI001C476877|nr:MULTISPECIES: glycosyltransferase [unclassified Acidovorax]MBV7429773.1 glycosyltransferase [Acidovorax sp. sif0732]MBV7448851.1 glycosyltransferase [Acidovorax sp. sif0715]